MSRISFERLVGLGISLYDSYRTALLNPVEPPSNPCKAPYVGGLRLHGFEAQRCYFDCTRQCKRQGMSWIEFMLQLLFLHRV